MAPRQRSVQVGCDESNVKGTTDLSSGVIKKKKFVCLFASCILSCQQVPSVYTCNHYLHTAGLSQWNTPAHGEHSVLHGLLCHERHRLSKQTQRRNKSKVKCYSNTTSLRYTHTSCIHILNTSLFCRTET